VPGVGVLHRLGRVHDQASHLPAHLLRQHRRRRLFDQLLVPPLNRALALAEVHHVAVVVADDLELDVAGVVEVLLDVDVAVAEGGLGLALRGAKVRAELVGVAHHAHAAAAAAGHRLDDHRVSDALGDLERRLFAVDRPIAPWQHRKARLLHRLPRARFVAEQLDHARVRPMKRMWQAPHTSAR
jgi:hypothetical protein